VNETHFAEIEKTLLYISEARTRAQTAAERLRRGDASLHLVAALEDAERDLEGLGRRLMQETYFAVPEEQMTLAPSEELTIS
jgi:hypothetical protein